MSALIAARISTRPTRCLVDPRLDDSVAVPSVTQSAHAKTVVPRSTSRGIKVNTGYAWLVQNSPQLLEVNGLHQMKVESGFFGTLHILLGAEAGERNRFDVSVCACLRCDLVTASIRQADVTQHHVDVVRTYDVDCL